MKYVIFEKNNTKVFVFAQFLRCVPSFAVIGPFGAEILGGGGYEAQNSPVHLGLIFFYTS